MKVMLQIEALRKFENIGDVEHDAHISSDVE